MDIHVDFGKKSMRKIDGARFFMKNLKTVKIKPSDAIFSFTVILTSFCPLLYVCGHYTIGLFICYFVTYFLYKKVSSGENGKSNKVTDCERKVTKLLLLKCPGSPDRNIEKMQLQ